MKLYRTLTTIVSGLLLTSTVAAGGASNKHFNARPQLPAPVTDQDYVHDGRADAAKVRLGAQLFFDKVLSGNFNISCASCHHPLAATGDGLSLPVGEGGSGLGIARDTGFGADAIAERVPRNSPAVFNLGAREFTTIFHDGRVQADSMFPSGFESPAGFDLPHGLDSALAVQAMFPVTSAAEMAGQPGENSIADAAAAGRLAGPDGVWELLAQRLRSYDGYVEQFRAVFGDVHSAGDIRFRHVANAIAAFEASNWRADNSPFDRYLRRERGAMSPSAIAGMRIFYSPRKGNCGSCHSGVFQTDHSFRAIAMPQTGPGKGDGASGAEDFGRERVTADPADRYRFRVPSLRNVALTAPYGHSGAYDSLEAVVRHHLDPVSALQQYDGSQLLLPGRADLDQRDLLVMSDSSIVSAISSQNELQPRNLSRRELKNLLDFLNALTDPGMLDLRRDMPRSLPSGLPLSD